MIQRRTDELSTPESNESRGNALLISQSSQPSPLVRLFGLASLHVGRGIVSLRHRVSCWLALQAPFLWALTTSTPPPPSGSGFRLRRRYREIIAFKPLGRGVRLWNQERLRASVTSKAHSLLSLTDWLGRKPLRPVNLFGPMKVSRQGQTLLQSSILREIDPPRPSSPISVSVRDDPVLAEKWPRVVPTARRRGEPEEGSFRSCRLFVQSWSLFSLHVRIVSALPRELVLAFPVSE